MTADRNRSVRIVAGDLSVADGRGRCVRRCYRVGVRAVRSVSGSWCPTSTKVRIVPGPRPALASISPQAGDACRPTGDMEPTIT
jgi:hypothetical protein